MHCVLLVSWRRCTGAANAVKCACAQDRTIFGPDVLQDTAWLDGAESTAASPLTSARISLGFLIRAQQSLLLWSAQSYLPYLICHSNCSKHLQPDPMAQHSVRAAALASAANACAHCCTGVIACTAFCPDRQSKNIVVPQCRSPSILSWCSMSCKKQYSVIIL